MYRKRAVTWPFIFYTIIWTLSKNYASYLKEAGIYSFGNTKFQILKIKDSLDGMQAMAVAPIVHSKLENKNFKNKKILANFRVLK
nr:hypothetical protein [Enterococcus lactis]